MKSAGIKKKKQWITSVALLFVFGWTNNVAAQEDNSWQFEATLYLWLTDINGTVNDTDTVLPGGPIQDGRIDHHRQPEHGLHGHI